MNDKTKGAQSGLDQIQPGNNPSGNTPVWSLTDIQNMGEAKANDMVRRVLYGMLSAKAWDQPICTPGLDSSCPWKIHDDVTSPQNTQLAREFAGASVVLLKNEGNLLPLGSGVTRVALLGSACDRRQKTNPSDMVWNE